jgi:2-C-methyl-D-erythritol 4-phosphate cytidylyltransferase
MSEQENAFFGDLGLVIAAGGASRRFGEESKLLADLGGMPVFLWSLRELAGILPKGHVALAVPKGDEAKFAEALKWHLPELEVVLVPGGASRTQSVLNALKALPASAKLAAVHDAARPFVKTQTLAACVAACRAFGGAVAAKKITDTVKEATADAFVAKTLDRSLLWAMETPQVFPREALVEASEKALAEGFQATDDAAVMERFSKAKVKLVENPLFNLKITYQADLELARGRLPAIVAES